MFACTCPCSGLLGVGSSKSTQHLIAWISRVLKAFVEGCRWSPLTKSLKMTPKNGYFGSHFGPQNAPFLTPETRILNKNPEDFAPPFFSIGKTIGILTCVSPGVRKNTLISRAPGTRYPDGVFFSHFGGRIYLVSGLRGIGQLPAFPGFQGVKEDTRLV